jgi:purine-binding chemotaxis protein CheW
MSTPPTEAAPPSDVVSYVTFFLGAQVYALRVLEVREILQLPPITPIPAAPASLAGVTNLRGNLVPVVDLAVLFGGAPMTPTLFTCVLIVALEDDRAELGVVGIIVDRVHDIFELAGQDVDPAPLFGTVVDRRFLHGLVRSGDGFAALVDLATVFEQLAGAPAGDAARRGDGA